MTPESETVPLKMTGSSRQDDAITIVFNRPPTAAEHNHFVRGISLMEDLAAFGAGREIE